MANTDILSNLEHFGQNISVRGADLWYGDFHAIRDISVDIPARQVTAFIGPSVAIFLDIFTCSHSEVIVDKFVS